MPSVPQDQTTKDRVAASGGVPVDFLQDDPNEMTFGRKLASSLMKRYKWYNPRLGNEDDEHDDDAPSLEKAWAYFEHVTLQRYIDDHKDEQKTAWQRVIALIRGGSSHKKAEPGDKEHDTKLYSPIKTPLGQMGDFGIGYGLYFSTLRSVAILCFVLGLINTPKMAYFSSDAYSGAKSGVTGFRKTSAICTNTEFVPCPTCTKEEFTTFPKSYPTTRIIFLRQLFAPLEGGNWLNVTDYVSPVFGDDDGGTFDDDTDAIFVDEVFVSTTFSGYNTTPAVDCTSSLDGSCYVDLTDYSDVVGDSQRLELDGGFALRNNCDGATIRQGFVNYVSMFVLICGSLIIYFLNNRIEVAFDEDEQTAQDYSILVKNPPADAYDPQEWKTFFEQEFGAQVAVCTVDVDNDKIIQTLVRRRELFRKIEFNLPAGYTMDDLDTLVERIKKERGLFARLKARVMSPGIPEFMNRIQSANKKIEELASKNHPVCAVFVTFETETAQRKVLSGLAVGKLAKTSPHMFRGTTILRVEEPEEPSTIRWQEQGTSDLTLWRQVTLSTLSSLVAIALALVMIQGAYSTSPFFGSIVTTVATILYPVFARIFTYRESHASETEIQKWLYIKIALFNVVTTVLYLQVATPFTATLDDVQGSIPGLITNVHRLFFSQLMLSPALQLADLGGHFKRHVLAPRAKTQAAMNNLMKGQDIDLSIRYANMTKFVFLMVWYCAIYPAAFFMCSFALFIAYYVDRFCLMRAWGHAPHIGTHLAHFARDYVFPFCIVVMAVISAYTWSGFPFDNLCEDPDPLNREIYEGEWSLEVFAKNFKIGDFVVSSVPARTETFTITEDTGAYRFCNQDLRVNGWQSFPALPSYQSDGLDWMTEDQEFVTLVYGWTTVAVVTLVVLSLLWRIGQWGMNFFAGVYIPRGRDMKLNYSDVAAIDAYIPQVESPLYEYPFILTNTKVIDSNLFSWTDPERSHLDWDLTHDAEEIVGTNTTSNFHAFAYVAYWSPHAETEEPAAIETTSLVGKPPPAKVASGVSSSAPLDVSFLAPLDVSSSAPLDVSSSAPLDVSSSAHLELVTTNVSSSSEVDVDEYDVSPVEWQGGSVLTQDNLAVEQYEI